MKLTLNKQVHVLNDDKLIYKIASFSEIGSTGICMLVELELVAGYDYVNPDENNQQGYVTAGQFVDDVQSHDFTWLPMDETIGERLKDEGFKVIDIERYKIHQQV